MENLFAASAVLWYKTGSWVKIENNFLPVLRVAKKNPSTVNVYNMLYNLMKTEQWLFGGEQIVCVYMFLSLRCTKFK